MKLYHVSAKGGLKKLRPSKPRLWRSARGSTTKKAFQEQTRAFVYLCPFAAVEQWRERLTEDYGCRHPYTYVVEINPLCDEAYSFVDWVDEGKTWNDKLTPWNGRTDLPFYKEIVVPYPVACKQVK